MFPCFVMSLTLKNSPSQFSYSLCNAQLDGACHQKYLGVYITCTLSWQLQCDEAKKKAMRVLRILLKGISHRAIDRLRHVHTYPQCVRLLNTPRLLGIRTQIKRLTVSNPFNAAQHVSLTAAWDQAPHWGKKEEKNGVREKNRRAKRAERQYGQGKGSAAHFPSPDYRSARFCRQYFSYFTSFFAFSYCGTWSQATLEVKTDSK